MAGSSHNEIWELDQTVTRFLNMEINSDTPKFKLIKINANKLPILIIRHISH